MFSLDEMFRSLAENGYGMGFVGNETKKILQIPF